MVAEQSMKLEKVIAVSKKVLFSELQNTFLVSQVFVSSVSGSHPTSDATVLTKTCITSLFTVCACVRLPHVLMLTTCDKEKGKREKEYYRCNNTFLTSLFRNLSSIVQ